MGQAVWLLLLCLLPLGEGTFSVSRQYRSRHAERGPVVIALDDTEGPEEKEPAEIFEEAKSRQARQAGSDPPQPYTTLAQLNTPGELYAIVHWDGLPQTTVFILTVGHPSRNNTRNAPVHSCTLWRSTDYGVTFVNETAKWPSDAKANWYYISQDDDDNIIFTDLVNRRLYVTRNEGETYTAVSMGDVTPYIVRFIPKHAPWLDHVTYKQYAFVHDRLARKLVASTDMFASKHEFPDSVTEAFWGSLALDTPGVIYFDSIENNNRKVLKMSTPPFAITKDYYTSYFDQFWLSHEYMFVVDSSGQNPVLLVSYNRATFKSAEFPNNLPGKHFSLVDASEGQVFMAVYHDVNNTAVYISEENGQVYTLSLSHLISSEAADWESGDPTFDLHLVEGLNGVLFANLKNPSSSYGASVVSYDKGGRWDPITPPAADSQGTAIQCTPPSCSLHLHMDTSADRGYSGILSRESAVGLVMAQGNIGSTLSAYYFYVRLYMSTNGGYTWVEVTYPHSISVYQFLDFGSLIVYSKRWSYTSAFSYSCDDGLSWSGTDFPQSQSLRVAGMLTELGEKALHATVFGYKNSFTGGWYIVGVNFTQVMTHKCSDDDYIIWSPTDEHLNQECLLGVHEEFERRNTTDCCYNGVDYEQPMNTHQCECTSEDYECDYGFQRDDVDSPCLAVPGMQPFAPPDDCPEGSTYRYPSGYRRVSLDTCRVGNTSHLEPTQQPCPVDPPSDMEVTVAPAAAAIGHDVEFTLHQLSGGQLSTTYTWDFNDTQTVTITGYKNARMQHHSFPLPGTYVVTVKATNSAGRSYGTVEVLVQDEIVSVSVIAPSRALENVPVALRVEVTTKHNKTYLPATFSWSFNNTNSISTTSPVLQQALPAGLQMVTCIVANGNGAVTGTASIVVGIGSFGIEVTATPEKVVVAVGYNMSLTIVMRELNQDVNALIHVTFDDDRPLDIPASGSSDTRTVKVYHVFQDAGSHDIHVTVYQGETVGLPAGSASLSVDVRKTFDKIHLYRPPFASGQWTDLVNASILFEFRPFHDDEPADTIPYGAVTYTVDYGDGGQPYTGPSAVLYHSYMHTGTFNVHIAADNTVSQATYDGSIQIVQAPTAATVSAPDVAKVNDPVSLAVQFPDSLGSSAPSLVNSLQYQWVIVPHHNTQGEVTLTATDSNIQHTFTDAGTYEVIAKGYRASSYTEQELLVTAQTTVIVRELLTSVTVKVDHLVALVDEVITASVQLYYGDQTLYYDGAIITLSVRTGESIVKMEKQSFSAFTGLSWTFQLNSTSSSVFTVLADNQIGQNSKQTTIVVVDPVDQVKLAFDLPSESVERNQFWLQQFQESIRQQLLDLLGFKSWILRVSAEDITLHSPDLNVETFVVTVTVLPANSSSEAVKEGRQHAQQVAAVSGIHHGFDVPEIDGSFQPYLYDTGSSSSATSAPGAGVIAGIVVGALVVIVAMALGLGTVITLLYRKYKRLEVRYSRLATSGVTFDPSSDDEDPVEMSPSEGGHASVGIAGFNPAESSNQ